MANKITFKLLVVLAELLTVGAIAVGVVAFIPKKAVNAQTVQIFETTGNVKYYDSEADAFLQAFAGNTMIEGQPIVTGSDSSFRLNLFDDGTAMHVEQFSSLTLISIGEDNGQPYARMKLDIGGIYLVPKVGVVYIETPEGTAFADAPGAILYVNYYPQEGKGAVSCLEGVCKFNHGGRISMLSAGQQISLGNSAQPVVDEIDQADLARMMDQDNNRGLRGMGQMPEGSDVSDPSVNPSVNARAANPKGKSQGPTPTKVKNTQKSPHEASSTPEPTKVEPTTVATLSPTEAPTQPPTKQPTQASSEVPTKEPTQAPTQVPPQAPSQQPTPGPTEAPTEEPGEMRTPDLIKNDTYHANPGIGWQYQGGDYPTKYPEETVAYAPRSEISWKVLNPADGVYNWSALDSHLNFVVSQGKQFSFRIYTMRGEDYGGHQVPRWVLDKGAEILPGGEVDYSNCIYQQEWGRFVNQLIKRYDGNPNIAYIDISGYGNFNEWSWQDQTIWDEEWANAYAAGKANRSTMTEMDSFARRRLADMFIGGSYSNHKCKTVDGQIKTVSYSYSGFSKTQLLMPYAGVIQSSQYVFVMDKTVGFRHDCLGRDKANNIITNDRLGKELSQIWPKAPVVFETCGSEFTMANAEYLLKRSHASLLHDVNVGMSTNQILKLASLLGYKFELKEFRHSYRLVPEGRIEVYMEWQNTGAAPAYPRMGQNYEMHVYFYDSDGKQVADIEVNEDISRWMPASSLGGTPPTYVVEVSVPVGENLPAGFYTADVRILDKRTGKPIWVSVEIGGFEYRSSGTGK